MHPFGEGEAIITNLNNYAMPLIRYNQGDRIVIDKSQNCYKYKTKIQIFKGINLESIFLKDGSKLNAFMLLEVMAEVNNRFKDILQEYTFFSIKIIILLNVV